MQTTLESHFQNFASTTAPPHPDVVGFFGPESMSWRLYREPIFLLGGVRALLLQIAHPAVAEGVARYSRFREDALGRGYRTFKAMATIYFGDRQQAEATAARLRHVHAQIRGNYPPETPAGHANQAFDANQPELQLWVLATLVDTSLLACEQLPDVDLPPDWREQFYEESKIAARVLGIPDEVYPPDLQSFKKYFSEQISPSGLLGTAAVSREVAQALLHHRWSPTPVSALLALGWLPDFLCEKLGIPTGEAQRRKFGRLLRVVRFFYRLWPKPLRYVPSWYQGNFRIRRAMNQRSGLLENLFGWMGGRWQVPFGIRV